MRFVLGVGFGLVAWLACSPGLENKPQELALESLLPADSMFYFRYDGYEPHRKAYDKTALARAMKDDLGEFLEVVGLAATELVSSGLKEKNPQALQKLAGNWKKVMDYLC